MKRDTDDHFSFTELFFYREYIPPVDSNDKIENLVSDKEVPETEDIHSEGDKKEERTSS